jgi:hypothetical protein
MTRKKEYMSADAERHSSEITNPKTNVYQDFIDGYEPKDTEVILEAEDILEQSYYERYSDIIEVKEVNIEPYDPGDELDVEFTSRHPEILSCLLKNFDREVAKFLERISCFSSFRKKFLESCKRDSEKIIPVSELGFGEEFTYVAKYPREHNEETYTFKTFVKSKRGRKKTKVALTTSGRTFAMIQLVLVSR